MTTAARVKCRHIITGACCAHSRGDHDNTADDPICLACLDLVGWVESDAEALSIDESHRYRAAQRCGKGADHIAHSVWALERGGHSYTVEDEA